MDYLSSPVDVACGVPQGHPDIFIFFAKKSRYLFTNPDKMSSGRVFVDGIKEIKA